jgi:DNA-binding MltR family transcriptional regulator
MSKKNEYIEPDFEDGLDLLVPGTKQRTEVLFRIGAELKKESDRGCALVAAAYLENEINELLGGFFVEQGARARAALFDFNGPVGTFSSKIKMSAALGLIPEEIHSSLDLIRKIRNEFAHLH